MTKFKILQGDITQYAGDAIVNAANSQLKRGHGVCGAIYAAAGLQLDKETDEYVAKNGDVPTGKVYISGAYDLDRSGHKAGSRMIVHAVGPVWGTFKFVKQQGRVLDKSEGGLHGEEELLRSAYRQSLNEAAGRGAKSIAFPCISTGIYGFPPDKAAKIAIRACLEFTNAYPHCFTEVAFYCFLDSDFDLYQKEVDAIVKEYASNFNIVPTVQPTAILTPVQTGDGNGAEGKEECNL
jgi:O-acetyl-ADP-ribose deacetylase (regulator of RNase III)